jgi:hypothetical protein
MSDIFFLDMKAIVRTMNSDVSMTDAFTGWIYTPWYKLTQEPNWIYLTLSRISSVKTRASRWERIQCNIVSHNEEVTQSDLIEKYSVLQEFFIPSDSCQGRIEYDTFTAVSVTEWNWWRAFTSDVSGKRREILTKDYIISWL